MTNPFKHKYLVRGALKDAAPCAVAFVLAACAGKHHPSQQPPPPPTAPLPVAMLAGQSVGLLPLTLVAAEDSLRWNAQLDDRRAALGRADSVLVALIAGRAPEVTWVLPEQLRAAARRSPGVVAAPDQLGTAVLRADRLVDVPDPLRSQLRTLVAMAGGRYALIPAALVYRVGTGKATAELSIVLVDVRLGKVIWRTVARGDGQDPWSTLSAAVKSLTPGLP